MENLQIHFYGLNKTNRLRVCGKSLVFKLPAQWKT